MNYPKLINKDLNNNVFEYDGGELWIRENVSFVSCFQMIINCLLLRETYRKHKESISQKRQVF